MLPFLFPEFLSSRLVLLLLLPLFHIHAANKTPTKPAAKPSPTPDPLPPNCEMIKIPTTNADNREMPVILRWPKNYKPGEQGKTYRVLFLFPFVPESAQRCIRRCVPYTTLADARDWFIICPTFVMPLDQKDDRGKSYYFPETWSGKAVLDALDQFKKKYPIDTNNLFLTGLSGGAKFDSRFADWAADRVTAVAVHSSGTFDDPSAKTKNIAWIITVGGADPILPQSADFVAKLNAQGALPVFRVFMGMIHEDYPQANDICTAYLSYYDDLTKDRVGKDPRTLPPFTVSNPSAMPFVGDFESNHYYKNTKENVDFIPAERRIYLPTKEFAQKWGTPGRED